jgi:hypothetical protein
VAYQGMVWEELKNNLVFFDDFRLSCDNFPNIAKIIAELFKVNIVKGK